MRRGRYNYPTSIRGDGRLPISSLRGRGPLVIVNNPVAVQQNTTITNGLDSDGYPWATANAIVVDKFNKIIVFAYNRANGAGNFVRSNDGGATWTDDLQQPFILRSCFAYDNVNDILHALWRCSVATDGVLYRRYTFTRDGSNNITAVVRDLSVNLQLDFQSVGTLTYDFHNLLWLNDAGFGTFGALVAVWSARVEALASNGSEIRTSMRVLTNTSADNTAANWKAPVTSDTTTLSAAPAVPYTILATTTDTAASLGNTSSSVARKTTGTHALDIYVMYAISAANVWSYKAKRMRWNAVSNDWSTGLTAAIALTNMVRSGTDGGYSSKHQIIAGTREDSINDRMVVGFSTWKDNVVGDTWSYIAVNNDDSVSSIVDVYGSVAANCGPTIFITGDVVVEKGYVVCTYTDLPNKNIFYRVFNGAGVEVEAAAVLFNTAPADIPCMRQLGLTTRYNNGAGDKLTVLFRNFNAAAAQNPPTYTPPYLGYFATLDWKI